jgi:hypothetical protein
MDVYLVDVDNGELYEDYYHSVVKVFTTYRAASQWLLEEGYKPFSKNIYINNSEDIEFILDDGVEDYLHAEIIEMEVEE